MASMFPILAIFILVIGLMAISWLGTPKGPNQTVIRTALVLSLACCYLMWMITYMAQLHPLIAPKKVWVE